MGTPIRSSSARPLRVTALGAAASVPWCCIVPAGLAAGGTASSLAARWAAAIMPFLLALSIGLFARAHHLLWVRRHGSPLARVLTVVLTLIAGALWALRLSPAIAGWVLE
jgi:hypothetical protein